MDTPRQQVLFGAAYYHEYQPSPRLDTDLDLMAEAGFSVIRVGESVWTTWEPEDGRFDLDWLAPVLDGAHQRGIGVILGTPTYAAPPWLARRYPEIAGETATGPADAVGRPAGDRLHPPGVPVLRRAGHPQDHRPLRRPSGGDRVPGRQRTRPAPVPQPRASSSGSSTSSATPTATSTALNEAWGLTYWSHRLSTWADLWVPDGNWQPQYDLAWRTFQAQLTTEFIAWQAEHRPGVRPRGPVRHDLHLLRAADRRRRRPDPRPRRDGGKPLLRHAGRARGAEHRRGPPGVGDLGHLDPVPQRRPDVRVQAGPVPDHRDQRRRPSAARRPTSRPSTGSGGRPPGRSWPAAPR